MHYRHGHTAGKRTTEYRVWCGMRARCLSKTHEQYADYGGRGITVCERWAVFENFLADMGACPPGHSLERKRNNEGYSPDNCAWATAKQQARNRRGNRMVTHQGETMCAAAWAERFGISRQALNSRMNRGTFPT